MCNSVTPDVLFCRQPVKASSFSTGTKKEQKPDALVGQYFGTLCTSAPCPGLFEGRRRMYTDQSGRLYVGPGLWTGHAISSRECEKSKRKVLCTAKSAQSIIPNYLQQENKINYITLKRTIYIQYSTVKKIVLIIILTAKLSCPQAT